MELGTVGNPLRVFYRLRELAHFREYNQRIDLKFDFVCTHFLLHPLFDLGEKLVGLATPEAQGPIQCTELH